MSQAGAFFQWFGVVLIVGAAFAVDVLLGVAAVGAVSVVIGLALEYDFITTAEIDDEYVVYDDESD